MKTQISIIGLATLLTCSVCFADSPPKDFLESTVLVQTRNGVANRSVSLAKFSREMTKLGAVTWDKGSNGWVMRINMKDDVTGKTDQISMVFDKHDSTDVLLTRIHAGNDDYLAQNDMLLSVADKFLAPIILANEKAAPKSKKSTAKKSSPKAKNLDIPESSGPQVDLDSLNK